MVEPERPQVKIIQRMRIACWITKAADTHSEYEIFIALARQHCLLERATFLCYMYVICLALDGLDLEDGTDRCSETSVSNYQCTMCNIGEELRSHWHASVYQ